MNPSLVIASKNEKKRKEIEQLLAGAPCQVLTLRDFPDCPDVEETGQTFEENARLKALEIASFTGLLTLADDSGLEVDALGGLPGIHSARFASLDKNQNASDEANIQLLLEKLRDIPPDDCTARFVCAMTLARPAQEGEVEVVQTTRGMVEGRIIDEIRGTHGFGYDPVFLVPQYNQTFAELGPQVKQQISHRARALQAIQPAILKAIGE